MTNLNWTAINSKDVLDAAIEKSFSHPILIYKHSIRCSLSSIVKSRMERGWGQEPLNIDCYFLDLINFRDLSNQVAERFGVAHESPQILIIADGTCVDHMSHLAVTHQNIKQSTPLQRTPL